MFVDNDVGISSNVCDFETQTNWVVYCRAGKCYMYFIDWEKNMRKTLRTSCQFLGKGLWKWYRNVTPIKRFTAEHSMLTCGDLSGICSANVRKSFNNMMRNSKKKYMCSLEILKGYWEPVGRKSVKCNLDQDKGAAHEAIYAPSSF